MFRRESSVARGGIHRDLHNNTLSELSPTSSITILLIFRHSHHTSESSSDFSSWCCWNWYAPEWGRPPRHVLYTVTSQLHNVTCVFVFLADSTQTQGQNIRNIQDEEAKTDEALQMNKWTLLHIDRSPNMAETKRVEMQERPKIRYN